MVLFRVKPKKSVQIRIPGLSLENLSRLPVTKKSNLSYPFSVLIHKMKCQPFNIFNRPGKLEKLSFQFLDHGNYS